MSRLPAGAWRSVFDGGCTVLVFLPTFVRWDSAPWSPEKLLAQARPLIRSIANGRAHGKLF